MTEQRHAEDKDRLTVGGVLYGCYAENDAMISLHADEAAAEFLAQLLESDEQKWLEIPPPESSRHSGDAFLTRLEIRTVEDGKVKIVRQGSKLSFVGPTEELANLAYELRFVAAQSRRERLSPHIHIERYPGAHTYLDPDSSPLVVTVFRSHPPYPLSH